MILEIDTRPILGNGGTVTLLDADTKDCEWDLIVEIRSPDGHLISQILCENPSDALDAYRHPFARPDVPDIFKP